ncbi:MAG: HAMP domain-containing histidine kinase [Candidatus Pacebacteria bacterium]|nr:HAMP domain-containing histidine kinase [Candidatus Paceibacterota bacterium]
MFHSARIKLTGWYLLIIMLISLFFSLVIYVGMSRELTRGFHRAELRLKARELGIHLPLRFSDRFEELPPVLRELGPRFLFPEDLRAAQKRVGLNLLFINGLILIISTGVGYFLAGRTLEPIQKVMVEQKRFVADASHEFKTPLTALGASMEVALRDKKLSLAGAKSVIRSGLDDVESLNSLCNNLLSLASLQANGKNFVFQEVDVTRVVREAGKKIFPLAEKKNIRVVLKLVDQKIKAHPETLKEMIVIFLDNAVKYTPKKGKITIKTGRSKKLLTLEISDTGRGIPEKDLPFIFDRFYRADQSRSKENVSGFGLGLSLAKKIIEIHQGSVEVKSRVGRGTTFTVKLPAG